MKKRGIKLNGIAGTWAVREKGKKDCEDFYILSCEENPCTANVVIASDYRILVWDNEGFWGGVSEYLNYSKDKEERQNIADISFAQECMEEHGFLSLLYNLKIGSANLEEIFDLEERPELKQYDPEDRVGRFLYDELKKRYGCIGGIK